jgi:tryptophan-rich sensory protein
VALVSAALQCNALENYFNHVKKPKWNATGTPFFSIVAPLVVSSYSARVVAMHLMQFSEGGVALAMLARCVGKCVHCYSVVLLWAYGEVHE